MFYLSEILTRMGDEVLEIIGQEIYMRLLKPQQETTQDQEALVNLALNLHTERLDC